MRTSVRTPECTSAATNLTTFNYLSNTIRVVEIDGLPWFVAKDVCQVLGLEGYASFHLKKLADDQVMVMTKAANPSLPIFVGKAHQTSVVSESGLYKLVMRSDKPEALKFQDRVTRDVLPGYPQGWHVSCRPPREAARSRPARHPHLAPPELGSTRWPSN